MPLIFVYTEFIGDCRIGSTQYSLCLPIANRVPDLTASEIVGGLLDILPTDRSSDNEMDAGFTCSDSR
jgi:hypothetical protein